MPLYASTYSGPPASSGVLATPDYNPDPPTSELDPVERPEFLDQWIARLAQVRAELSAIMVQDLSNGVNTGGGYFKAPSPVDKAKSIEDELVRCEQRKKLEVEEASLVTQINGILYVAAMRITPDIKPGPQRYDNAVETA